MAAEELSWIPDDVDITKPNAARVYDYILGGANNFDVDRVFAKHVIDIMPDLAFLAIENRSFLRRSTRFLVDQGIRQFLDLGSGIPSVGSTHEVVQAVDPNARVVYVDFEAVAVAHSEMMLADNDNAAIVRADYRDVPSVLDSPVTRSLIDFSQPVGLLMFTSMHFVADSDSPKDLVAAYRDATVAGSYLALSHATADDRPEMEDIASAYGQTANAVVMRSKDRVAAFLDGYELVDPGLVFTAQWRGELDVAEPWRSGAYAAVGRKI
ncbi:MAG TPA: SAM-dependent methyltransferase [Pseudonocardiaceae bacterium]|jgi:hypothetical protein|nr:SAM-dependent methyltransferase [Pseudonocardiaceae bacterium]